MLLSISLRSNVIARCIAPVQSWLEGECQTLTDITGFVWTRHAALCQSVGGAILGFSWASPLSVTMTIVNTVLGVFLCAYGISELRDKEGGSDEC